MKQFLVGILFLSSVSLFFVPVLAQEWFPDPDPILTRDLNDIVGTKLKESESPLRDGSYALSEGLRGIFNEEELTDTATARDRTSRYIKGVLNYILGVIGLVALVYLLFQGYRVLVSGSNEDEYNKGMKGMKYAALAILGVGLSWFLLSIIFWLLQVITAS